MPNITGTFNQGANLHNMSSRRTVGSFYSLGTEYPVGDAPTYNGNWQAIYAFDAERGRKYWHQQTYGNIPIDSIFGNSTTVQPPAVTVRYYIRAK